MTAPGTYTVNRHQDGAEVRAQLDLTTAKEERAILNAQSRIQVGLTGPVYDEQGVLVRGAAPIFRGMYNGQICHYEVRASDSTVVA